MHKQVRFLMIGGFLGAGKTTAIARLARHYMQQGLGVGLVTNDQSTDLVDTHALRAEGFLVGEVPGACFCCNFDDLVRTAAQLESQQVPDVVIAEPVGSCTDLVATVLEPLQMLHGDHYVIGPLAVLLKPEHGWKILRREKKAGFSPRAAYIFRKQLEEADIIAINKIDKLADSRRDALVALAEEQFPGKQVLTISARRGDGFEHLTAGLASAPPAARVRMQVDYDVYADGEAELGWLNCQLTATRAAGDFPLDHLVLDLVETIARRLDDVRAEAAHVKVLGQHGDDGAVGNLVAGQSAPELSRTSSARVSDAQLIVNARVATSPEQLEAVVRACLDQWAGRHDVAIRMGHFSCLRPGRPVPTHRIT